MAEPETLRARASGWSSRSLGADLRERAWFHAIRTPLAPGGRSDRPLAIPQGDLQHLARSVVRRVADLPVEAKPQVVWTQDRSELLVHLSTLSLQCAAGLVTVGICVECGETGPVPIPIPIAVGTRERPAGLVMQAFSAVDGPPIISRPWSEALTAFAWELLVETARSICAEVGRDQAGRPLIPGAIGAAPRRLLIEPMARHTLGRATR